MVKKSNRKRFYWLSWCASEKCLQSQQKHLTVTHLHTQKHFTARILQQNDLKKYKHKNTGILWVFYQIKINYEQTMWGIVLTQCGLLVSLRLDNALLVQFFVCLRTDERRAFVLNYPSQWSFICFYDWH